MFGKKWKLFLLFDMHNKHRPFFSRRILVENEPDYYSGQFFIFF